MITCAGIPCQFQLEVMCGFFEEDKLDFHHLVVCGLVLSCFDKTNISSSREGNKVIWLHDQCLHRRAAG